MLARGSRLLILVVLASVVMPIINDIHLHLSQLFNTFAQFMLVLFKILWTTTLNNFIVFILDSCIPGPIEVKLLCLMKVRLLVLDDGGRLLIVYSGFGFCSYANYKQCPSAVKQIINDIQYVCVIHVIFI